MRISDWSSDVCSSDLVLIYESPLDRLGEHHFSMHMIQHNIAMMFVPPLIYLGAPATPILKGLPRSFRQRFVRSEEHTSELQSLMRISYAVFCLKKKK